MFFLSFNLSFNLFLPQGELEGVVGVAMFAVHRPADGFIDLLESERVLLGDVAEHAVDHFGLIVAVLALLHVRGLHLPLRQVNIAY